MENLWLAASAVGSIGLEGVLGAVGLCTIGGVAGVVGFSTFGSEARVVFSAFPACEAECGASGCLMVRVKIKAPAEPPELEVSPSPSRRRICPLYAPAGTGITVCRPPGSVSVRRVPFCASEGLMASVARISFPLGAWRGLSQLGGR